MAGGVRMMSAGSGSTQVMSRAPASTSMWVMRRKPSGAGNCSSWSTSSCSSGQRSDEHTSELQSLMRISYAVFCLKKKIVQQTHILLSLTNTLDQILQLGTLFRIIPFYFRNHYQI